MPELLTPERLAEIQKRAAEHERWGYLKMERHMGDTDRADLLSHIEAQAAEFAAIAHAARLPDDYEHGLPAWVLQLRIQNDDREMQLQAARREHTALQALYDKALGRIADRDEQVLSLRDKLQARQKRIEALTVLADAVAALPADWWTHTYDGVTYCAYCPGPGEYPHHTANCPAAAVLKALAALDEQEKQT